MSHILLLWKAPVTEDPDEAARLLAPYYASEDDSAFTPSADVAAVAAELLRRYPEGDDAPWAEYPPAPAERLLMIDVRSSADDAVLDDIVQLAFDHQLVLYDPQGPDVGIPPDPSIVVPDPPIRLVDHLKMLAMGLAAAGVFWVGWRIDIPVLDWVLMIVGGFVLSVVLFLVYAMVAARPEPEKRRPPPRGDAR